MARVDAREGKWRGNWRMDWVASTLHTTSEHGVSALLPLMSTPRLPVVDWNDAPAGLNGLVRFAERRNLVSACVPSHFKRSLPCDYTDGEEVAWVAERLSLSEDEIPCLEFSHCIFSPNIFIFKIQVWDLIYVLYSNFHTQKFTTVLYSNPPFYCRRFQYRHSHVRWINT